MSNRLKQVTPKPQNALGISAYFNALAFFLHLDFVNSLPHNFVENAFGLGAVFPFEPSPISLQTDDPIFTIFQQFNFLRGLHGSDEVLLLPREQLNIASAWLDGANIYGTNIFLNTAARSFADGKLRSITLQNGEEIPPAAGLVKAEFAGQRPGAE